MPTHLLDLKVNRTMKKSYFSLLLIYILIALPVLAQPMAEGQEKWLGNVYSYSQSDGLTTYWNQITPENAGKWGSVEGSRDNMNWSQLDEAYNLAKSKGYPFRFHVLVWGAQQPTWMNSLSASAQLEEIVEWFQAVADRYPDLDYVEVVNEPLHQRPDGSTGAADYWDALGGPGETGWDWVIKAFELARDIFPDSTKLMINDYGIISSSQAVNQYLEIIELLKERQLIDAIGVQAHAFSNGSSSASGTSPFTIRRNLNSLAKVNLPIQATEMDIDGLSNGTDRESDAYQLNKIKEIFPVFWEHEAVEGVTFWGWKPGLWRTSQQAYLWNDLGRPRSSFRWLQNYVDTAQVRFAVSNEGELENNNHFPTQMILDQNYPNPFNPSTTISFYLEEAGTIELNVYNSLGQLVTQVVNEYLSAGNHVVPFTAHTLPTGMYFYELRKQDMRLTKSMLLIK